jgi:hypothetical protein
MSEALRSANKLRVDAAFGGRLKAADAGTGLADSLAVYEVSLDICLSRLVTS